MVRVVPKDYIATTAVAAWGIHSPKYVNMVPGLKKKTGM